MSVVNLREESVDVSETLTILERVEIMDPEVVREIEGELYLRKKLVNLKPWLEFPELEDLAMAEEASKAINLDILLPEADNCFYLSVKLDTCMLSDDKGNEQVASFVRFSLCRKGMGVIHRISVPAEFCPSDEDGNQKAQNWLGQVKLAGDYWIGDVDEETGLRTCIEYAYSGIYLSRRVRGWLDSLAKEVGVMEDGAEFLRGAAILGILINPCKVS